MDNENQIYETIVIGGGPIGLYLCKLLEEKQSNYLLIEGFKEIGGLCISAYPYKPMYDIPGLGPTTGKEFIEILLKLINPKKIHLNEKYESFEKINNIWHIKTNKNTYKTINLVFSTGAGLGTYNKPIVNNLELYENKQVFFFPQEPSIYKNKKVLVFGGGDSALDAVQSLLEVTDSIVLIHRRNTFVAMEGKLSILNNNNIKVYKPYNLKSLNEKNNLLESVTITSNSTDLILEMDYVFFCYGYSTTDSKKYKVNITTMMNEDGFFAIGAASIYDQKRDLITSGMWECRIVLNNLKTN